MKLKTTVYLGHDLEWNVIVTPTKDAQKEDIEVFRRWAPPGEQNTKVLIYSPKIAMVPNMVMRKGMSFAEYNREKMLEHIWQFLLIISISL